ncbi:ASCH domain-containing protein [Planctomycetales bacterium ZRK34]|nr:ASCH domain-containing protein [Planctomycetales bacterium ZRK34]
MAVHVAIVTGPYDRLILEGRKTIECRLTRQPRPPFGCIVPGQRVFFKRSSGPFFAAAIVDRIWMTDNLTPAGVDDLRKRFNDRIHGQADYWQSRRNCRYGTLIWLRDVWPCSLSPRYRSQNMRAWYTLEDDADPLNAPSAKPRRRHGHFDITLTAGSLRQNQVRLTEVIDRFPRQCLGGSTRTEAGEAITLHLRGGETITTDIVASKKMFRWRGWKTWFAESGLAAGDRLRFTPIAPRAFSVTPIVKSTR